MADKNRNIDKAVQDSFANSAPQMPKDLWSGLKEDLDGDSLDHSLKSAFESDGPKAPERVWKAIDQQLFIDRVWKGIKLKLDRRSAYVFWRRILLPIATAAMVLLLWPWLDSEVQEPLMSPALEKEINSEISDSPVKDPISAQDLLEQEPKGGLVEESMIIKTKEPESPSLERLNQPALQGAEDASNAIAASSNGGNSEKPEPIRSNLFSGESFEPRDLIPRSPYLLLDWPNQQLLPILLKDEQKPSFRKPVSGKWSVGLQYQFDQFTFSNNITRQAQDQNSLISQNSNTGSNYAVFVNYQIARHSSIYADFTLNENSQQSYNRFGEGLYLQEAINYRYQNLRLMYQLNWHWSEKPQASALFLGFGPYYAFRSNVNLSSPFGAEDLSESYADRYGLSLRVGHEHHAGALNLFYGVQGLWDLNNFYQGTGRVPASFDVSRNQRLGVFIGVSYTLN